MTIILLWDKAKFSIKADFLAFFSIFHDELYLNKYRLKECKESIDIKLARTADLLTRLLKRLFPVGNPIDSTHKREPYWSEHARMFNSLDTDNKKGTQ